MKNQTILTITKIGRTKTMTSKDKKMCKEQFCEMMSNCLYEVAWKGKSYGVSGSSETGESGYVETSDLIDDFRDGVDELIDGMTNLNSDFSNYYADFLVNDEEIMNLENHKNDTQFNYKYLRKQSWYNKVSKFSLFVLKLTHWMKVGYYGVSSESFLENHDEDDLISWYRTLYITITNMVEKGILDAIEDEEKQWKDVITTDEFFKDTDESEIEIKEKIVNYFINIFAKSIKFNATFTALEEDIYE